MRVKLTWKRPGIQQIYMYAREWRITTTPPPPQQHTHTSTFANRQFFFLTKYNQGNLEGTCMYHRTLLINDYLCTVDVLLLVMQNLSEICSVVVAESMKYSISSPKRHIGNQCDTLLLSFSYHKQDGNPWEHFIIFLSFRISGKGHENDLFYYCITLLKGLLSVCPSPTPLP